MTPSSQTDPSLTCRRCGRREGFSAGLPAGSLGLCEPCLQIAAASELFARPIEQTKERSGSGWWKASAFVVVALGVLAFAWFGGQGIFHRGATASAEGGAAPRLEGAAAEGVGRQPEGAPESAAEANVPTTAALDAPQTGSAKRPPHDAPSRQVTDVGNIHLLYVTQTEAGFEGLSSRVFATKEAPSADSAKLVTKVGDAMQASFQEGLRYVHKQPRTWEIDYSIRLSFEDRMTPKDGGSAGAAFTVAMLAAIDNFTLDPDVAMTGDLTIDGTVQPVGAVVEKLRGAIGGKCKVTLVPERNARDVVDLALLDGTSPLWETQIFTIGSITEATSFARKDRPEKAAAAIARFALLRTRLPAGKVTPNFLRSPVVVSELKEVVALAPNHLSAATLLQAAEGQLPRELSLNRSVEEILAASFLFTQNLPTTKSAAEGRPAAMQMAFPERAFSDCVNRLNTITPLLDQRSIELKAACISIAGAIRAVATYKPGEITGTRSSAQVRDFVQREKGYQAEALGELGDARARLLGTMAKLRTDGALRAEMMRK